MPGNNKKNRKRNRKQISGYKSPKLQKSKKSNEKKAISSFLNDEDRSLLNNHNKVCFFFIFR